VKTRLPQLLVLLLAAVVAACAPSVDPSAEPTSSSGVVTPTAPPSAAGTEAPTTSGRPVSATAQADGVVVTLSASSDRIAPGEEIRLGIGALNLGLDPVTWMSGGCGMLNDLVITGPDIPQQPPGQPGGDAASLARWSALSMGGGIAQWRPPDLPDDVMVGCPANLDYDEIGPAGTMNADATWRAVDGFGAPAPAGDYVVTVGFPYIGRLPVDQVGGEPPPIKPIRVSVPVVVDGPAFEGISASEAIDAATADPRVAAWFAQLPKERLGGAHIRLVDDVWEYAIDVGAQNAATVVRVDPSTAEVIDVRLAGG
jgi:hypothetical protein